MTGFLSELSEHEQLILNAMRQVILEADSEVAESIGNIMSSKNCFIYNEQDVFKYGLAKTKHHFSFHSMVMYTNKDVFQFISDRSANMKLQKGCINFKTVEDFPLDLFKKLAQMSGAADFSAVINHYKNKK